jgi:hypothetical protein
MSEAIHLVGARIAILPSDHGVINIFFEDDICFLDEQTLN